MEKMTLLHVGTCESVPILRVPIGDNRSAPVRPNRKSAHDAARVVGDADAGLGGLVTKQIPWGATNLQRYPVRRVMPPCHNEDIQWTSQDYRTL